MSLRKADTRRIITERTCGCEHVDHETGAKHVMFGVPAGTQRALYVGEVCDECARTCMAAYLR